MIGFEFDDNSYFLKHDCGDDSRKLVDEDGKILLKIDSRLRVTSAAGDLIGSLESENDEWVFHEGQTRIGTGCEVRDYSWRTLLDAEVVVCKHCLKSLKDDLAEKAPAGVLV